MTDQAGSRAAFSDILLCLLARVCGLETRTVGDPCQLWPLRAVPRALSSPGVGPGGRATVLEGS